MTDLTMQAESSNQRSLGRWLTSHWFGIFVVVYGLWIWLPWLAPVLMQAGWNGAGRALYLIYSIFCHQLPERSFFLFGNATMYPLSQIQAVWQDNLSPLVLRRFIGTEAFGWKVAWSDRMVSFYSAIWLTALIWWPLRRKLRGIPWLGFFLLLVPMGVDGLSHMVSDFSGLGLGFRDSNEWLRLLTAGRLPIVYAGDALGSFNSWARLITGVLAGFGLAWFALPHVERSFVESQA